MDCELFAVGARRNLAVRKGALVEKALATAGLSQERRVEKAVILTRERGDGLLSVRSKDIPDALLLWT
jgi:hypothetical protein